MAFATDKTGQKVADFPKPICKLPPAVDQLEDFIFHPLAAKLPVVDSIYNALVARNDSLKASIEPASLSGADTLAALILVALETDFDGGDEIAIAGKESRGVCKTHLDSILTQAKPRYQATF